MPRLLKSPLAGGIGALASIMWEGFWLVGPPLGVTSDADQRVYLLWGLVTLTIAGIQAFTILTLKVRRLEARLAPKLSLVFDATRSPYVHDKLGVEDQTLRVFSVGVTNSGDSADVKVKLVEMTPAEQGVFYPAHELQVMGQPTGTMSATVHRGTQPLVFFDVIGFLFGDLKPANSLHVRYAAQGLFGRQLSGNGPYRLTLSIDGPGAPEAPMQLILKQERDRLWTLIPKP